MKTRVKKKKPAVTRDDVYGFAHGCIEHGEAEAAAVAVICFEWLQRPENVIAGHIRWSSFRTGPKPTIRIEHHKAGEIVDHPLEDDDVKFYAEAEGQQFIAALRQALQLLGWRDGRKIRIDIRWGENDVGLEILPK